MSWTNQIAKLMIFAAFLTSVACGQTDRRSFIGQISGIIVDPSGAAVTGAKLQARNTEETSNRTTESDLNGAFLFSGLVPGEYRLIASKHDFETREISVRVAPNEFLTPLRISLAVASINTTIEVQSRTDDLIGIADSGTQGTVGATEIQTRPILRSGEILETVPGVIITQHAGGGKANQYFLRGFNLDHGTDFAIFIDDMPLNLPSHAHGEGYSDMNTVIPEFVRRVNFEKGPYYGNVGNYGSAGAAHIEFFKTLPQNFSQVEGGNFGFGRAVFGGSRQLGAGNLLLGGEVFHDDGPWKHPDKYVKLNGLLIYSRGDDSQGLSIGARAYHGKWNSSDQIAEDAVPFVGLFGTLDPTDGGESDRYSLQFEWRRMSGTSASRLALFGFRYDLDLFSNFTYFLTDIVRGDQFEQQDKRWVAGLDASHTFFGAWLGRKMMNTIGVQVRNDWIRNGLYQSESQNRTDKLDDSTGNVLPATTQADRLTDTQTGLYAESRTQWYTKFRSVSSVRGDIDRFSVTSLVTSANSGTASKALPGPKLSLIFGPWSNTEFYVQGGFSFHSNDGRGTTQTVEPVSGDNPEPNTRATPIPPIIPTKGGEVGVRTLSIPHLQSTASIWYLHSASELQQSGDTGGTTASRQPSNRYGLELANYFTLADWLTIDFDFAQSRALFTAIDADDAAPGSPGGRRVPEAVGTVISSGVALPNLRGFLGSLRVRYFGPRDLTSDALYRSRATALLNGEVGYRIGEQWLLSAEFLNLLNRRDHDIDYAYQSRITPTAQSSFTDVFHPVEPFQARFGLHRRF